MLPLTPTEKRLVELYDQGLSYKEIAARLDISVNTAKTHARRIILKTLANSMRHAAWLRRLAAPP